MITTTLLNGTEFGIDESNNMFIGHQSAPQSRIYLGKATTQNFIHIIGYMKRLEIHMEQNHE